MNAVNANGVALGIESFGDDRAPLVLLAGATTMLSWHDAPEWSDREAVAEFASARADILGDDPVAARANAAHIPSARDPLHSPPLAR